jgi:mono/diheme cytochrome c family protein
MKGKFVLLAGTALLLGSLAGADDGLQLRAIGEGRAVYVTNCAACHGADARGGIAPDPTAIRTRDGAFSVRHVTAHVTGRRDGFHGTMPSWDRVLVDRWPGGQGPALLQTWKLAKYIEFVQAPARRHAGTGAASRPRAAR